MIFHGFVQAGGGSTRFGTDKALCAVGGENDAPTDRRIAGECVL